jgi:CMP-N-acetylneuraminic acid synthetase
MSVNYNYKNRPRRQDWEGYLVENGAFYISNSINILESKNRISGNIGLYKMDEKTYYEIDSEDDWKIIENLV